MHLSFLRKVLASVFAIAAIGVVGTASASAAVWNMGGKELIGSESLASATNTHTNIKFEFSGIDIECTGAKLTGGKITAPNGGQLEHLVFTGCVSTGSKCSLVGTKMESVALKLEAKLGANKPEDTLVIKPASGKELIPFEFSGSSCAYANEEYELTGQITAKLPTGQEELAEQELVFATTTASGELKWGSFSMSLSGAVDVKLASGEAWSFL